MTVCSKADSKSATSVGFVALNKGILHKEQYKYIDIINPLVVFFAIRFYISTLYNFMTDSLSLAGHKVHKDKLSHPPCTLAICSGERLLIKIKVDRECLNRHTV